MKKDRHGFESFILLLTRSRKTASWFEMLRSKGREFGTRVAQELRRSISDEYTPFQIACSFSIGVFITMMPTLGAGFLVFAVLIYVSDWINPVALFASAIVLNPVVKWGVYASSLALGFLLLGPTETVVNGGVTVDTGQAVLYRLLLGNTILAIIATIIAFVLVYRFASWYQPRASEVVETVIEESELET